MRRASARVALRVATGLGPRLHLLPAGAGHRSTRSTRAARRPGRRPASRSIGSARRSRTRASARVPDVDRRGPRRDRDRAGPRHAGVAGGRSLPVLRSRDDLVRRHPADRAAGHRHRHGLSARRSRRSAFPLGLLRDHRRPRDVLHRPRLQQRARPPAPDLALARGGVGGPGRRHVADVPPRDAARHADGDARRRRCSRSPCRSTRSS